ncbi:MAG: radical SAM protein [Spirochaetes bacterium]|nr:radical SAM protein [Spirochaetota bacterium]
MCNGIQYYSESPLCNLCPRECGVVRSTGSGYCTVDDLFPVASICLHNGEEPVIDGGTGICNVFFEHCNLQCIFCQNYQISRNSKPYTTLCQAEIVSSVLSILDIGVRAVGFVSPSHVAPQMIKIINALKREGRKFAAVMNTNGYDKKDTLESLEGIIDVYLPDFKYMDSGIASEYSGAGDYPETGVRALREMYRQKGSELHFDSDGNIQSGLIIRHLVLPGHVDNSKRCLQAIAEELSPSVHISLMSQYYPTPAVRNHPRLGRTVSEEEFSEVTEELNLLGFRRGWIQERGSDKLFRPDFGKDNPFDYSIRPHLPALRVK